VGVKELIGKYVDAVKRLSEAAKALAEALLEIIRKVVPDTDYSLGWAEAGINTICFYSDSHSDPNKVIGIDDTMNACRKATMFLEVIWDTLPELRSCVDTPFGFWLTKEEAEKLKKLLREARRDE